MHRLAALDEKRAQGMPGDVAPESLVRGKCAKEMRTSINRYNRTRRHSLRDVGRLIPCSPRCTGLFSHRRSGRLVPELDTSVGVPGPHGFVGRVACASSSAPTRPSQPASRFVTIGR